MTDVEPTAKGETMATDEAEPAQGETIGELYDRLPIGRPQREYGYVLTRVEEFRGSTADSDGGDVLTVDGVVVPAWREPVRRPTVTIPILDGLDPKDGSSGGE